jgi:mono/diheme cytochrome c family protein
MSRFCLPNRARPGFASTAPTAVALLAILATVSAAPRIAAGVELEVASPATASDPHAAAQAVLEARCIECHGPDAQESALRLDSRAGILRGGDFGPAAVDGKADSSELLRRVKTTNPEQMMPPDGERLTAGEVAAIAAWIEAGLPWPGREELPEEEATRDPRLDHWAWQPIAKPPVPAAVAEFAGLPGVEPDRNAIDFFIRQKLAEKGLAPSPVADRAILIRRLAFDLVGLPPTPEEVAAFVNDPDPEAYENLVDQLLASPRYGERWARHWLDVVHYGDTHGYDKDKPRPHAWPYRDYVIRAFNADKPYARFIEEQVAGDVLYPDSLDGHEATGFIAAGPWDLIGHTEVPETKTDGKIALHLDRDDMVANTIGTFASVTIHCAQCHNHKFDPITQDDYYSLQAVFAALDREDRPYHPDAAVREAHAAITTRKADLEKRQKELEAAIAKAAGPRLAELDKAIAAKPKPNDGQSPAAAVDDVAGLTAEREALLAATRDPAVAAELEQVKAELKAIDKEREQLPPLQMVYSATARKRNGSPRPIHVLSRGNVLAPTHEVSPGALTLVEPLQSRFDLAPKHAEGDRRVALARWLADSKNPLTWRSLVNRVWHYHFGQGIVATPSDFGRMGAAPTHPKLLDWLATDFRDGGGSIKAVHRLIVTSAAYRQSSAEIEAFAAIDSDNALLWRQNRRKLEAEAVRDAVLAVAGTLDPSMGGPGWQDFKIEHPAHSPHYRYDLADPEDKATWRRGVYRFIVRSQTQPFMTVLDCADPSMRVEKRNQSISALQALALLNNGFMTAQACHFAARVEREAGSDTAAQVDAAMRLALSRPATPDERAALVSLTDAHGLANTCRAILNLNEFSFVD